MNDSKQVTHIILSVIVSAFVMFSSAPADAWYYGGHRSHHGHYKHHGYGYGYRGRSGRYPYRYRSYGYSYRPYKRYSDSTRRYSSGDADYAYKSDSSRDTYNTSNGGYDTGTSSAGSANDDTGWTLLAEGKNSAALNLFARQAKNNPRQGLPKAGYALASASMGDLKTGVWAMRRAFRIDPDALHYLSIDDQLKPTVQEVIDRYESALKDDPDSHDSAFMTAALAYLVRDTSAAQTSITRAINLGDDSESATNLQRRIKTGDR